MWLIRSVIILVGVITILWLFANNADQHVDFDFFTKSFPNLSVNILVLFVFAAGFLFGGLILIFSEFQLRHTISRKQREVDRLERELAALRNLPLEGESDTRESQFNNM